MKKWMIGLGSLIIILLVIFGLGFSNITGRFIDDNQEGHIPESEQKCMSECVAVGCEDGDEQCAAANAEECMAKCGANLQPRGEDEQCVQACISRYCEMGEKYIPCNNQYIGQCDEECGMVTDPGAQNEEEQCIRDCVSQHEKLGEPIMCQAGTEQGMGEQGGTVCQMCAEQCVHLYDGPCLTDEKWKEKESECNALGEHVDGEPIYGDSGEGYECVIDLECVDYSSEWGDDPGTGPGIGQEGYVASNTASKVLDGMIKFFKGVFGEEDEGNEDSVNQATKENSNSS